MFAQSCLVLVQTSQHWHGAVLRVVASLSEEGSLGVIQVTLVTSLDGCGEMPSSQHEIGGVSVTGLWIIFIFFFAFHGHVF